MSCFPTPYVLPSPCFQPKSCDEECKPEEYILLLGIGGNVSTLGLTPLYNQEEVVNGSVSVQTGSIYQDKGSASAAITGQYTMSQQMVQNQTLFNTWLVFMPASDSIHIQWFSSTAGNGAGFITGGTGKYASAKGQVTITVVENVPVNNGETTTTVFRVKLVLYC